MPNTVYILLNTINKLILRFVYTSNKKVNAKYRVVFLQILNAVNICYFTQYIKFWTLEIKNAAKINFFRKN